MAAAPADIAAYTTDGIVLTSPTNPAVSAAIAAAHIDARTGAEREIEMFFDSAAHAQVLLDERFGFLSQVNPPHLGIEVEEAIDIGNAVAIVPAVPRWKIVDEPGAQAQVVRTRAYAHDMGSDRFSVEVLG